jgi:hypothetical protein
MRAAFAPPLGAGARPPARRARSLIMPELPTVVRRWRQAAARASAHIAFYVILGINTSTSVQTMRASTDAAIVRSATMKAALVAVAANTEAGELASEAELRAAFARCGADDPGDQGHPCSPMSSSGLTRGPTRRVSSGRPSEADHIAAEAAAGFNDGSSGQARGRQQGHSSLGIGPPACLSGAQPVGSLNPGAWIAACATNVKHQIIAS